MTLEAPNAPGKIFNFIYSILLENFEPGFLYKCLVFPM